MPKGAAETLAALARKRMLKSVLFYRQLDTAIDLVHESDKAAWLSRHLQANPSVRILNQLRRGEFAKLHA